MHIKIKPKRTTRWPLTILLSVFLTMFLTDHLPGQEGTDTKRPEGDQGIAASHPGDRDIRSHASVVFVEDFNETSMTPVYNRWESARGKKTDQLQLSDRSAPGSAGETSLLMKHIGGGKKTIDLYRRLRNDQGGFGYPRIFCRMYVRFGRNTAAIHHMGTGIGGNNPPNPWPEADAGNRPAGDEQFTVSVEPFGQNWAWDYYVYWHEMRGSPPNGKTWGNRFINNPDLTAEKGTWQCIEVMVKLNDVGKRNGELALWINGKRASHLGQGFPRGTWIWDKFHPGHEGPGFKWENGRKKIPGDAPFQGFSWRTTTDLKVNYVWPYVYITDAPEGHVSKIWFDQIVVATEYIGPIKESPR